MAAAAAGGGGENTADAAVVRAGRIVVRFGEGEEAREEGEAGLEEHQRNMPELCVDEGRKEEGKEEKGEWGRSLVVVDEGSKSILFLFLHLHLHLHLPPLLLSLQNR